MPPTLIVTGASRGIGAAIALKAAQSEYQIVVNYAKDQEAADQVVEQIRKVETQWRFELMYRLSQR